ncbi:MAG: hypothetical protein HYX53_04615 [Chloroflexi bacterium]|nr:hypothetical protein [Chloroflexota bacterium]
MRLRRLLLLTSLPAIALLIAAAAAAGSMTAAAANPAPLPFRVVMPGLAGGGAAVPSPGEVSSQVVAVHLSASTIDGLGGGQTLTVYGEVRNGLDHAIAGANVSITVLSPSGAVLATGATIARADTIPAGGTSPFLVGFPTIARSDVTLQAEVTGYTDPATAAVPAGIVISVGGPQPIPIGEPDPRTGEIPMSPFLLSMDGTINNTSANTIRITEIIVAMYLPDGTVGLVASTSILSVGRTDGGVPLLGPGESASFRLAVPKGTLLALGGDVSTRTFVNATVYTSPS